MSRCLDPQTSPEVRPLGVPNTDPHKVLFGGFWKTREKNTKKNVLSDFAGALDISQAQAHTAPRVRRMGWEGPRDPAQVENGIFWRAVHMGKTWKWMDLMHGFDGFNRCHGWIWSKDGWMWRDVSVFVKLHWFHSLQQQRIHYPPGN